MKYYRIVASEDLKVHASESQTKLAKGYDSIKNNGYKNVKSDEFPDFLPNYELELHTKAMATSILPKVAPSFGLIIDNETKELFKKFKLPPHAFYPSKVHHNNKVLEYFWFHYIVRDFWKFIDKDASYGEIIKFNTKEHKWEVVRKFPLTSKEQSLIESRHVEPLVGARIGEVIMKEDFPKYDLYEIGAVNIHSIVSELLRDAMINNGLTGFEFKLFDRFKTAD